MTEKEEAPCIEDAFENGADEMPPNGCEGAIQKRRKHSWIQELQFIQYLERQQREER